MTDDTDDISELEKLVAEGLAAKIRAGEAKAADYAVALQYLKAKNALRLVDPDDPASVLDAAVGPFDEDAEIDRQRSVFGRH